jgi:ribosome-associated protein YbcJ (S4-like RNA binding protein)
METFYLECKTRIKLWKLLKKRDFLMTKREAKDLIIYYNIVLVNGIPESRPGKKVSIGDIVEIDGQEIMVE